MPILERQVRKKTAMVTREILREGRVPTALEVALDVGRFIRENAGQPTMRPRPQARGVVWDHRKTNDVLEAIAFDLDIAYEEALGTLGQLVDRYSRVELSYAAQRFQLGELISLLRNLLFVSKNAEDNFFGVYDTFDDLTKVDVALTTRDCVDLNEGVALLPQNDVIADRVDMSHLYSRMAWPVSATIPEAVVPPDPETENEGDGTDAGGDSQQAEDQIVQNEPAPNAGIGLAFSDMINSWRQVVTTNNGKGVTIEFTVPLGSTEVESKTISQVSITPDMSHVSKVQVLHSLDNVNYTKFPNITEEFALEPGKVRRVDFEATRCRFVRFLVTLDTPTVVNGVSHTYIFGFKNIAFYKLGRAQEAELVSLPLSAEAMTKPIDRVSLSVTDLMPAGCAAQYFVAAADENGDPREGIWRPITPISKAPVEGIPQVIKFSESGLKSIVLPPPSPAVIERSVRAVDYYQLTETALVEEPLFRQAFLYRGENAWWRNTQRERITRAVRDNFVDFNSGDVQNLYVATTEIASVADPSSAQGSVPTVLSVSNPVDYDPATMQLKPSAGVDPEVDQRPRYAIYQILMFRDQMTIEDEAIVLTGTTWTQMANSGIVALGSGRPVVTNVGGTVTYLEGIDYELESGTDGTLTGRIRRIDTPSLTSNIASGATVEVTYDLDPDITHLVRSIDGHDIKLSKDMSGPADQYFQVTYRFVPLPPNNEVKKATLKVTEKYGDTIGEVYQEGRDFLVDSKMGTITRIPGGEIKGDKVVFVDFRYEQRPRDLDTFSAWFYVDIREPFLIEINPLAFDFEAGERLIIDSIDMSRRTSLGEFLPGWHKVTVRSKRPEAYNNAAVKQVAALLDRSGKPVFIAGGSYFTQMKASRIPMLQRSVTQLTKNTAKTDHGYFAITPQKHVIVNFEPGTTEEIYTYGIRYVSGSMQAGTWAEEFRLEYTHALSASNPVQQVLFKALLTRNKNTEAGLTPRLFEYHLRLG